MSDQPATTGERAAFLRSASAQAEALALSFDDPAALARNLATWIREHFPERVAQAYWVSAKKDTDKGIDVRIFEKQLPRLWNLRVRVGALLGAQTGGVSVTVPLVTSTGGISIGIGVGAVSDWSDFREFTPVFVLRASF